MLLAGILSDTMNLTISTTTVRDKKVVKRLSSLVGINPDLFAREIIEANNDFENLSSVEILKRDFKVFRMGGAIIGVGQIITGEFKNVYEKKKDIFFEMNNLREKKGYEILCLMITNPFKNFSELWISGDRKIIKEAFGLDEKEEGVFILKGVLSRKKDFIVKIGEVLLNKNWRRK